jgi:acetyl-CoA acetyltransferase family protein
VMSKAAKAFARDMQLFDTSLGWRFINPALEARYGVDSMGQTAENVAEQYGVSRDDQDRFSVRSQQKAAAAREAGRFAPEIAPLEIAQRKGPAKLVDTDEFIRPGTTSETLARLKCVFRTDGHGSVTAGNSSGLNDGAAALLIASGEGARSIGASPMTRILATAVAGVDPRIMGLGPVPATRRALELAGVSLAQMDVIELNEAFAAQSIACLREFGIADDDARVNPNGGAIALGHPLGMSGARLLLTASHELVRTGKRYALATMCVGVGQGMATVLERV